MSRSLISIITPTYNRADLILEAIDSVLAQTYTHWEMIIVDDGSTDDTAIIVKRLAEQDPRILYHYQENAGQSSARQFALSAANGDFVAFLDSDNRWLPHRLQCGLKALEAAPECSVAYGDVYEIDERGARMPGENMKRYSGQITEHLVKDNCVSFNTSLTRREAIDGIGGFDSKVKVADDYDLWLRLSVGNRFVYVPEFLAEYRVMENQISSDKTRRYNSNTSILDNFFKNNPELRKSGLFSRGMSGYYLRWSQHFHNVSSHKLAWSLLFEAFKVKPVNYSAIRKLVKYVLWQ